MSTYEQGYAEGLADGKSDACYCDDAVASAHKDVTTDLLHNVRESGRWSDSLRVRLEAAGIDADAALRVFAEYVEATP